MRRLPRKWTLASLAVFAASLLFWALVPVESIRAIASLSNPARLATLGERGANSRLNKIVYWLDHARGRVLSPEATLDIALALGGNDEPRLSLVRESLLRNLKIADGLGVWTESNRAKLRHGQAATVMRGPYQGEPIEIDHIVPRSLAPELDNELANLEMLPRTLNRQKSDRVGERQMAHARKLFEAGLLKQESWERLPARP